MTVELTGRVAIVTGAAQGMGAATARKLAERGARVAGIDLQADRLREVMGDLPNGVAFVADVTDAESDRRVVEEVHRRFGGPHILVNVAGGLGSAAPGLEELTPEAWHQVFALNVDAPLYLAQAAAPYMKELRWGRIITVGSGAGLSYTRTRVIPYAASKASVHGLMRQLAVELGPFGITCNVVAPGLVPGERTKIEKERHLWSGEAVVKPIALRRVGEPMEVANVIAFLASEEASYITAQTLIVDGGRQMF
jgi:3-oxoacyl-[acyl-carrier protein] reductase